MIFYQLYKRLVLIFGQLITPGNVKNYSVQGCLPDTVFRKVSYFHQLFRTHEKHSHSSIRMPDQVLGSPQDIRNSWTVMPAFASISESAQIANVTANEWRGIGMQMGQQNSTKLLSRDRKTAFLIDFNDNITVRDMVM